MQKQIPKYVSAAEMAMEPIPRRPKAQKPLRHNQGETPQHREMVARGVAVRRFAVFDQIVAMPQIKTLEQALAMCIVLGRGSGHKSNPKPTLAREFMVAWEARGYRFNVPPEVREEIIKGEC